MDRKCCLVMEDGTVFSGDGFGAPAPSAEDLESAGKNACGEVVFNTGMSGYVEIVTDPSYTGQVVVMTYPHIGNYGVDKKWWESGPPVDNHGSITGLSGLVVRSLYTGKVPGKRISLDEFLSDNGVCGITGVDTRALTIKIRDGGSNNGVIVRPSKGTDVLDEREEKAVLSFLSQYPSMKGYNLVSGMGVQKQLVYNHHGSPHIVVVDCGIKTSIVTSLLSGNCRVTVVPNSYTSGEILEIGGDGVLVSNGPGDPAALTGIIQEVKNLAGKIPLSGICLGHQIIGLALGAKTVKMKFGHHGINHPVRNLEDGKVIITSQNHGFMIDEKTLPEDVEVWMRNSNDNSIEAIKQKDLNLLSTQFHPESAPGPHDALWIFDEIIDLAKQNTHKEGR